MAFKIAARTILQLGAELISSDAVALYELIKNAIDARSKNGVEIRFQIVMLRSKYDELLALIDQDARNLDELKSIFYQALQPDAEPSVIESYRSLIDNSKSIKALRSSITEGYRNLNSITVADTGHGMTKRDLEQIFLTIGTSSRSAIIAAQLKSGKPQSARPDYLGEKGVGRLSAMRLGRRLRVETTTEADANINILDINWRDFEEAYDKSYDSVHLEPEKGPRKPEGFVSGTKIAISDLSGIWTRAVVEETIRDQLTRLTDPFSFVERRRFPVRIIYNGTHLDYATKIRDELLKHAHAVCTGHYRILNGRARLELNITANIYAQAQYSDTFDETDLIAMTGLDALGIPASSLRSVGPFDFELYWFNRQKVKSIPDVGNRQAVLKLIQQWAGIMLFRDGYRVLPYGDEGDDWLELDREALSAGGYKLNTKQFIGRVRIGRYSNPTLLDQTNRQGLQDCSEKFVLKKTIFHAITGRMRGFLDECAAAEKKERTSGFDKSEMDQRVNELEGRAKAAIKIVSRAYMGPEKTLQQVTDAFAELKDAYNRAVDKLGVVEDERERMTHLAGIGLMVETVAHELARAAEHTQKTLREIPRNDVDDKLKGVFKTLESQLSTIQKRLRILEPLSVPARQRRAHKDIGDIAKFVLDSHQAQFERHNIEASIRYINDKKRSIQAFVVEGMVVQILENLIANSVYWLKLYKHEHPRHEAQITILLGNNPPSITYADNGPGIPVSRREVVFEPFYSTKETTARHGLGLYIARENAELMKGTLTLVDEPNIHKGRLNAFLLELAEGA